jgi:steroid delta-isomerase-like uncharacterized protein
MAGTGEAAPRESGLLSLCHLAEAFTKGKVVMTTKVLSEETVRKQIEEWNSRDADRVAAGYAEDATVLDPYYPEPLKGREAVKKDAGDFFTAFPDLVFTITNVLSIGDKAGMEGHATGTHTGPLALPTGLIPATNRRLEFNWAVFIEVDAMGQIREEHRYYDVATQMQQLGLMQ